MVQFVVPKIERFCFIQFYRNELATGSIITKYLLHVGYNGMKIGPNTDDLGWMSEDTCVPWIRRLRTGAHVLNKFKDSLSS